MRKSKKIILTMLLLSSSVFTASAKDLTVGMRSTKFPFSYKENGVLAGFEYDLVLEVCKEIDKNCVVKGYKSTKKLFNDLKKDNIDFIFSTMDKTEKRKKTTLYSMAYIPKTSRLIKSKSLNIRLNKKNVENKVLGVIKTTSNRSFVKSQFNEAFNVFSYNEYEELYADLISGSIDFIFLDELFADFNFLKTEKGQGFEFIGPSFTSIENFGEGAAAIFSITDIKNPKKIKLRDQINQGLERVWKNGMYLKLSNKYFGKDVSNGIFDK